jgi:hypothetical protein
MPAAAAGLLALSVLSAACGGGSGGGDATPTPDPGDCGQVKDIAAAAVIGDALVTLDDLPAGFDLAPADPRGLESVGDQFFQDNVDPASYVGGKGFAFGTNDVLDGGQGQFIASIVVAFTDEEAASLLVQHPSTGDPIFVEDVEAVELGDESKAIRFSIENSEGTATGYVYQFRAGQMVAYLANVGAGEEVTLEQTEELATLMCQRSRDIE